ncbi:hypothetical protein WAI453_002683 [Rhynchosporium graminicola]
MIPLPQDVKFKLDPDHWGLSVDPSNEEHCKEPVLNNHIYLAIETYRDEYGKYLEKALWDQFRWDFDGWTVDTFKTANRNLLKALREILMLRRVRVDPNRGNISLAQRIYDCLTETAMEPWNEECEKERLEIGKLRPEYLQIRTPPLPKDPLQPPTGGFPPPPPPDPLNEPSYRPYPHFPLPEGNNGANTDLGRRLLIDLMKCYHNDDNKYGGELFDILDVKLQYFLDWCAKLGIDQFEPAFATMLKGRAQQFYYDKIARRGYNFELMVTMMKQHFQTQENLQEYLRHWREIHMDKVIRDPKNAGKSRLECLEITIDTLQKCQRGLTKEYQYEHNLRDQVIAACRGVPECELALFNPASTFEGVCAQLRASIGTKTSEKLTPSAAYLTSPPEHYNGENDQNWVDRKYYNSSERRGGYRGRNRGRGRGGGRGSFRPSSGGRSYTPKCNVCKKVDCWSTKHTPEERKQAYLEYKRQGAAYTTEDLTPQTYATFLTEYEGIEGLADLESEGDGEHYWTMENYDYSDENEHFVTEFGQIDALQAMETLANNSAYHAFTKDDKFGVEPTSLSPSETFIFTDRYSSGRFQGIMPDTGASGISSAGEAQFIALQKEHPGIKLDTSLPPNSIVFGSGSSQIKGIVHVPTPVGIVTFHVVTANTPFLMCLQDMDRLGVKFDNLRNVLQQGDKVIPVVRKWGHPWMMLESKDALVHYLTEGELRQIHRRLGHPSMLRLQKVLDRAGHEVDSAVLKKIQEICHHCQLHAKSPGRFKFTLKDDVNFNYSVILDIMYLHGKPVLHVVDDATAFNAAEWLKDMSADTVWSAFRHCWIDVYVGPPDRVVHDAGTNFSSTEFRQNAKSMSIEVVEVPVEAHNAVGKVERYHGMLRRAYEIIEDELKGQGVSREVMLQMAIKAINNTAGPKGLVPTLLVFGTYPRLSDKDAPSPTITQRALAISKATKELRQLVAGRSVADALAMRNGPDTSDTLSLPLNSEVRVWREKATDNRPGWTGPFKLISTEGETCVVQLDSGPKRFRSTIVKPYLRPQSEHEDDSELPLQDDGGDEEHPVQEEPSQVRKSTRGRIPRRRFAIEAEFSAEAEAEDDYFDEHMLAEVLLEKEVNMAFLSRLEKADLELSKKLRQEGVITTPGEPFQASDQQEIEGLLAQGVFEFVQYDHDKHAGTRIFDARFVRSIKGKSTPAPFEKSRIVIQAYNDEGKQEILTQSPTIQRPSQKIIMSLAPSLEKRGALIYLRDITQAYTQSNSLLKRLILARIPKELRHLYPPGTLMVVLKALYGIPEAGTHWWVTYYLHHIERLHMETSTYDPCLLISTNKKCFGIAGLQTDDTFGVAMKEFLDLEEQQLAEAKITAKSREILTLHHQFDFNGCLIVKREDHLFLGQKGQAKKIQLVDETAADCSQKYMEQRARGAYIASICQPEASFDLSVAAQHQNPTKDDVRALNKRLQWQIDNLDRGIKYIDLDLSTAKIFVFVDGSFANNKDLSSQLGYLITISNESSIVERDQFIMRGNLIHASSTKSKRVTRSSLASEVYGMVAGVDMAIAINTTITKIMAQLDLPPLPLIVCTDSYSLYECLVKIGTTKEKRLMIDIMALRQSYQRREIMEIRWIDGTNNPADALTKSTPNRSLELFLSTNQLIIGVEGWVQREV